MATGLGKTVTFANIPRHGKMLILSHREELVTQPLKYFDCKTSIERAQYRADQNAEVISASVQSLTRRLNCYNPEAFDIIIVDEAHHAAATSYKRILNYFKPRLVVGFTATPNRADGTRMNDVFSDIIFERDLRWGIKNGYLSDILCKRVHIGFDLSAVRTSHGDYAPGELEEAMDGTADAIAQAYRDHAKGATLIFAVSVHQAEEIASRIDGAVVVTGETKNRSDIIRRFTSGEIPCIVNCMVFTEGTDIPRVETVIIARPTQSESLYVQMVGRGLRLSPGKDKLILIDCVGVTGKKSLCTAPSLLGIDITPVPERNQDEIEGMLFDLPMKVVKASDTPESWIKNVEIVNLWAREQSYNLHGVNWFKQPDGSLTLSVPKSKGAKDCVKFKIPCHDELGKVSLHGEKLPMQKALDMVFETLQQDYADQRILWDLEKAKRWGSAPATDKQVKIIARRCKDMDTSKLNKLQANMILSRLFEGGKKAS